jgi:hypothetical protein
VFAAARRKSALRVPTRRSLQSGLGDEVGQVDQEDREGVGLHGKRQDDLP